ncbi:MAG: hypothetical protein J2P37_36930 [Ktedonobacteraceae bacterium]|nr:hypothetical protein [Ktedonobacteraceae bacterium]
MSFLPPSAVRAKVRFSPGTDPALVLDDVSRGYVRRFGLHYDYWQVKNNEEHAGFPAPGQFAAFHLGQKHGYHAFIAHGAENGNLSMSHGLDVPTPELAGTWVLELGSRDISIEKDSAQVMQEITRRATFVRELAQRFPVLQAHIWRVGNNILPSPPHASPHDVLFIAKRTQVQNDYVDPEVYWRAWDSSTDLGDGRVLLTRVLDVPDEVEFKRRIWAATWEMARAARPGLTSYARDINRPKPGEVELLEAGEATLTQMGYYPPEQWIEFTCVVLPGFHITPREIYMLHDLVVSKEVDGKPLQYVRVAFPTRSMAQREARVLFDIGVRVFYLTREDTWEDLEELKE